MSKKWDEEIIVVKKTDLFEYNIYFQGIETNKNKIHLFNKAINKNFIIARRGNLKDSTPPINNMEKNTKYKQIIPYTIIKKDDKIFVYERLNSGGESRLHNKLSIGVGGHMNCEDKDLQWGEILLKNLDRELNEELSITCKKMPNLDIIGMINDDEDEVGLVHFGILISLTYDKEDKIVVRETDQLDGYFLSIEDLKKPEIYDRMESWSKIAIDNL